MNAENFSEWQRRQKHKVIRTKSSYWYEASPHVFQAFPFHWVITPSEKEVNDLNYKKPYYCITIFDTFRSKNWKNQLFYGTKFSA